MEVVDDFEPRFHWVPIKSCNGTQANEGLTSLEKLTNPDDPGGIDEERQLPECVNPARDGFGIVSLQGDSDWTFFYLFRKHRYGLGFLFRGFVCGPIKHALLPDIEESRQNQNYEEKHLNKTEEPTPGNVQLAVNHNPGIEKYRFNVE